MKPALLEALTLVVPCYNEAKRFDAARFSEALSRFSGLQLLLVNDGSSDGTESVIEAFAASSAGRIGRCRWVRIGGRRRRFAEVCRLRWTVERPGLDSGTPTSRRHSARWRNFRLQPRGMTAHGR